jgi:hypothetical protein
MLKTLRKGTRIATDHLCKLPSPKLSGWVADRLCKLPSFWVGSIHGCVFLVFQIAATIISYPSERKGGRGSCRPPGLPIFCSCSSFLRAAGRRGRADATRGDADADADADAHALAPLLCLPPRPRVPPRRRPAPSSCRHDR